MKKILIVTKHLRIGGTEKMLLRILPIWAALGYKIDIVLLYHDITLDSAAWESYATLYTIFPKQSQMAKKLLMETSAQLYNVHIKKLYDIEIAFQEGAPTKFVSQSKNIFSQKIAWIHSNFLEYHFSESAYFNRVEEEQTYNLFNKIVFCSNSTQSAFNQVLKVTFPSQQVIYSPIDIKNFFALSKQSLPIITSPYFLVLSRLSPQKGIDRLLKAVKYVKEQGMDFRILIIGDGELKDSLFALQQSLNLNDQVSFIPSVQNPFPFIRHSICYICPSYTESFGLAMQEALLFSVPIIACRTPGAQEVLQNGNFGELVDSSAKCLGEALTKFLTEQTFAEELKEKAILGCEYWKSQENNSNIALTELFTKF